MNRTNENRSFLSTPLMKAATCLVLTAFAASPVYADNSGSPVPMEQQQQKSVTVKGTVKDSQGEPLMGVSILEKGTTNGIATDINGNFTLNVKSNSSVLVFSYVGFETKEIKIGNQRQLKITLQDDAEVLKDAIVIGYGTQRKGDVTSAITSVKAEDFAKGNISDASDLIKGKVAGLNITNGSGDPNSESTIRLRGVISLNGANSPLVLIDGIEGDMTTVAPENIESIDVLKDASAAAIYGTRGASGVIIITTKAGRRDQRTNVSYSGYASLSSLGNKLDFMTAEDVRNGLTSYTDKGYDTDWLDAVTRTSFTHNHNVSISGGGKSTTYSANVGYRNQQGVILNTNREEIRMNFDISQYLLNDILKLNFNFDKRLSYNNPIGGGDYQGIYRQAIIHNPTEPIWNEDGTHTENFAINYYFNPVNMLQEKTGKNSREFSRMTANITLEPIKGWKTNLKLSRRSSNSHSRYYLSSQYYSQVLNNYTGYAYQNQGEFRSDELEVTSNYKHTWDKHRFDALVGYSYQYNVSEGFSANNYNFPTDFYECYNLGLGTALKDGKAGMSSYKSDSKLIGFFGRVSYGYDNRYNILLSIRREGSSKFGKNHKWGSFPSVSAGWTISNEEFMKDVTAINNLKLRAGYGITGVIPGSSYLSLTRYTYGGSYYYDNGKWNQGLAVASNPNPDLKWETSGELNIGLDWSILNDRLGGSIDWYNKNTRDMLWDYDVPTPPNLYSTTLANVGKMRNRGIEVAINAVPVKTKNFQWKTTITASHNSNKLVSLSNDLYETANEHDEAYLDEPISVSTQRLEVGKSLGQWYGMKSVGVSPNGLWMVENKVTGEVEEFNDKMLTNDDYHQYLGNALPKVFLGWSNSLNWKNWDLSMQFTSQLGMKILNESRCYYENNSIAYNRLQAVKEAPYADGNKLSSAQKQTFVSYYLENGNFLKLTNLTLGYSLPLHQNKYVKNIRLYASANNLFCITGYKGLDPELSNNDVLYSGIESRDNYPITRTFTFGINVDFADGSAPKRAAEPVPARVVEKEVIKEVVKEVPGKSSTVQNTYVVTFEVNSSEINNPSELSGIPAGSTVEIVAYASPEGDADANVALSQRRADAVAKYLESKGIKVVRTSAKGADTKHANRIAIVTVK